MSITVRKADLHEDRLELIRFCQENLPGRPDVRRFEWLYLDNPFGTALTLIASDSAGRMIGIASAFPRNFWVEGSRQRAWILGDFCISDQYRTLGPAVTLQRACMASLPPAELWYDFPSPNMLAVYRRLGVRLFSNHIRYVKLLKLDRTHNNVGSYAARAVSSIGNWKLRRAANASTDLECSVHEGSFGDEFTELDSHASSQDVLRGSRTAAYLNWRYRQTPNAEYKVITARKVSRLAGYLVTKIDPGEATLADLIVVKEDNIVPILLAYSARLLSTMGIKRINASLLGESALASDFRMAGFVPRESLPVVVHRHEQINSMAIYQPQNWLLLHGDRES